MKKRLWAIVLAVCMTMTLLPTTALADNEEESDSWAECTACSEDAPHMIATAQDLDKIRTHTHTENGVTTITGYFKLANDIDLAGVAWTPIGDGNTSFSGSFSGNNNTIANLQISNSELVNVGVFGVCKNATISNITLKNFSINANYRIGTLAGVSENCTIDSIEVDGANVVGKCHVGGIIGRVQGAGTTTTIKNCKVNSSTIWAMSVSSSWDSIPDNSNSANKVDSTTPFNARCGGITSTNVSATLIVDGCNIKDTEVKSMGLAGGFIAYSHGAAAEIKNSSFLGGRVEAIMYTAGGLGAVAASKGSMSAEKCNVTTTIATKNVEKNNIISGSHATVFVPGTVKGCTAEIITTHTIQAFSDSAQDSAVSIRFAQIPEGEEQYYCGSDFYAGTNDASATIPGNKKIQNCTVDVTLGKAQVFAVAAGRRANEDHSKSWSTSYNGLVTKFTFDETIDAYEIGAGYGSNYPIYIDTNLDSTKISVTRDTRNSNSTNAIALLNGGSFSADTIFEADKLATPIKSGYTFAGWYENVNFSGDSATEATANNTYYAKWEPRQLSSIEVTAKNPSVPYGTVLSTADLTVTAIYDNGEHEEVTAGYTIAPSTELKTLGENTVTVTYQSKTAACNITVAKAAQSAPAAPTLKTSDYTGITLNTVEANANGATAQYRCNDGAWQDSPEFTGLTAGTVYTFAVRYGETDTYAASEAGDTAEFSTLRYFPGSSGSSTGSPVTVSSAKHGDVTVSPKTAKKGDTVTITVTPDKGYTLETLTVLDKNGSKLTLTDKGNGQYTFTMPDGKVEVKATFMDDNTMLNYFVDVKADDYYYDAVLWAVKNGITKGVSDTDFGPDLACTRAQIVTFLWRAAGSPEPKSVSSFTDVSADSYYAKAVAWAVENGITGGTGDGRFSPDAPCTREQAVAFLYRASGSPAVSGGSAFSDVAADAYYASAVTWAEQNGVTGGIGGGLFGSGNDCTRAQIVTFLYRAYQGK